MRKDCSLWVAALCACLGCEAEKLNERSSGQADAEAADVTSGADSTTGAVPTSEPPDLSKERSAFVERLSVAVDLVQKARKKREECPTSAKGVIHVYSLPFAQHIAKSTSLSKAAAEMTAFRPPRHQLLAKSSSKLKAADAPHLERVYARELVAIVVADKLVMPTTEGTETFLTGELKGWVHVVDLVSGKVKCAAPLKFLSSKKVEWTESLSPEQAAQDFDIDKSDAAFHVRVDFFIQGHAAITKALASIGPDLKLELRGSTGP